MITAVMKASGVASCVQSKTVWLTPNTPVNDAPIQWTCSSSCVARLLSDVLLGLIDPFCFSQGPGFRPLFLPSHREPVPALNRPCLAFRTSRRRGLASSPFATCAQPFEMTATRGESASFQCWGIEARIGAPVTATVPYPPRIAHEHFVWRPADRNPVQSMHYDHAGSKYPWCSAFSADESSAPPCSDYAKILPHGPVTRMRGRGQRSGRPDGVARGRHRPRDDRSGIVAIRESIAIARRIARACCRGR